MSVEFKLPSLGEGVKEADVAEILVSVGDQVQPGKVLMELETEKAVMELPAEFSGTIERLLVQSGQSIAVGQAVLTYNPVGAAAAAPTPAPAAPKASAAPQPVAAPANPAPAATPVSNQVFACPNLGEGVKTADIAEILVKEGDVITADQAVMELETEKAVMELPCPLAGKVTRVLVKEGDTIAVGTPLLEVLSGATAVVTPPAPAYSAPPKTIDVVATATPAKSSAPAAPAPATSEPAANGSPVPAAPSTRRLARELGVDLNLVKGTGSGGRITAEDVQSYVRNKLQSLSTAAAPARSAVTVSAGGIAPPPLPDFSRFGLVEREAMNKIARVAAENLTVSWNVIPHVTQHDRADITALEEARKRFSDGLGKNGPKVTMTAIVMKALATCLKAFPKFNSSLDPETNEIVYKKFYNIGCAVDTPTGLVVPVVRDCDKKSIIQIAADITELATRARDRKLSMDNMQGATCTVTNLGGIGGIGFTPIVNYPEVCILGMSRGQTELKLVNGQVTERLMLPLSLSYDHRVINGADAARFLVTLCNMLSDPFQLMTTV